MKNETLNASRRRFLKNSFLAGALAPFINADAFSISSTPAERLKVHIFSKHLQFLNYKELAEASAGMGFDGVDLAVRPGGHVVPERVDEDLPKAVEELKKAGLAHLLMTTAVNEASDPTDKKLLTTASRLGFTHYRMNWYAYPDNKPMPEAINEFSEKIKGLALLNKDLGLTGYYQNHAGTNVGSVIWEIWEMIKDADSDHMGVQYDIRHAMVEGATSWENSFRLISPRIKAISLKDFRWKQNNGKWMIEDVPVGEGMIDFVSYFKLLKKYRIDVPVSLHVEYSLGGAEKGNTKITMAKNDVLKAIKKDLVKIHEMWERA